jgi:hypothetical protein
MSWRESARPYDLGEMDWRSSAVQPEEIQESKQMEKLNLLKRLAGKLPAEFFGGAIGSIPSLAEAEAQFKPIKEKLEKESLPAFLSSTGLEPSPEKGLSNLLAYLGEKPATRELTIPSLREKFKKTTEGKFEPETSTERVLSHIASSAGSALPFGAPIGGIAFGAGIGETAREIGIPDKIANILELVSSGIPTVGKNKLLLKENQKKLANYARKKGLTETEITPLLKGEFTRDTLSKLAFKGPRTKKVITGIQKKADAAMSDIAKEASSMPRLNDSQNSNLVNGFEDILYRLEKNVKPAPDEEKAIEFIKSATERLKTVGADPEELVNFWRSINRGVNWKNVSGSKDIQFRLKQPILDTFKEINPQFAADFELTNELFKRYKKFEKGIVPDLADKFKLLGTGGAFLTGVATLNVPLLKTALGAQIGQLAAREMLINPRLYRLHAQAIEAINRNNLKMANVIVNKFVDELKNIYPEETKDLNIENISS